MPTYIKKDFAPTDKTYDFLKAKHQIPRPFLDEWVTEHFSNYWNELKDDKNQRGRKTAWQTTYINWSKSAWRGRLGRLYEENLHKRSGPYGKCKPNLIQEVAAGLIAKDMPAKPFKPPTRYRLPDPPKPTGETITQDEAFKKLDAIFGVKS